MPFSTKILSVLFCVIINFTIENANAKDEKIWSVKDQSFITEKQLITDLITSRYVMLGEIHDNKTHHQHQAEIINQIAKYDRRPTIAFEMVNRDKQAAFTIFEKRFIQGATEKKDHDSTGLDMLLDWQNSGWPDWTEYKPVFDAAMIHQLPIAAANLSSDSLGKLHENGLSSLPGDLKQKLMDYLPENAPEKIQAALAQEISTAHCNALPAKLTNRFADIQRIRDALFAKTMTDHETLNNSDGAILITGNIHARKDYGVPYYLNKMTKGKITSLAFTEMNEEEIKKGPFPYDYLWLTTPIERPDPCAGFSLP